MEVGVDDACKIKFASGFPMLDWTRSRLTRMQGADCDPGPFGPRGQLPRVHDVGQLGLGVGVDPVVLVILLLEVDVAPVDPTLIVSHTRDDDDPETK